MINISIKGSPVQIRRYPRSCNAGEKGLVKWWMEKTQLTTSHYPLSVEGSPLSQTRDGKVSTKAKPEDPPGHNNFFCFSGEKQGVYLPGGIYIPSLSGSSHTKIHEMKKRFLCWLLSLSATSLHAQLVSQKQEQDTTLLDEAVITANKFPNKTSLTGKVITVITKEQLERSGGKDLSQVLTEQAGIYITGANSNAGKDKSLYLPRRQDWSYIDHHWWGAGIWSLGYWRNFDIRNLSVNNIERIEILKGSQSTLYGSDAIAGVINVITKKHR